MTDDSSTEDLERRVAELEMRVEKLETELDEQGGAYSTLLVGTVGYIGLVILLLIAVPPVGVAMTGGGLILAFWIVLFRLGR